MTLERGMIGNDTVVDKVVFATAAITLGVNDQVVRMDATGGAFAVTLPNVSEARGLFYTFIALDTTGDITLQDQNESELWTDLTFAVDDESAVLYSDGRTWHVLLETIA